MVYYADTSALVKLVVAEPESPALQAWIAATGTGLATSDLTRTELLRAVRRAAPTHMVRAREVLDSLTILRLGTATFESAALLDPEILRSLDAVHLAAALELGEDLDGMLTYDDRMAHAARLVGVAVVAPAP